LRGGLLARAVTRGLTKGYRHHPQLDRFRSQASPLALINTYLAAMAIEADQRGYSFDRQMVGPDCREIVLRATQGQLAYEPKHPLRKLWARSPGRYARWRREAHAMPHSRFKTVPGIVESWEHKPDGVPHR